MPDDALPQPWPAAGVAGPDTWFFTPLDALSRPMSSGEILVSPVDVPGAVAAPVKVQLRGGVASAPLQPGTYLMSGTVKTRDGKTTRVEPTEFRVGEVP